MKVAEEWELKHREELFSSYNIIQELEARVVKKKEIIIKKWAYATKLEGRLSNIKTILQVAEEQVAITGPLLGMLQLR